MGATLVDNSEYTRPALLVFGHPSRELLTLYQQSWEELADRLNEEAGSGPPPRAGQILQEHDALPGRVPSTDLIGSGTGEVFQPGLLELIHRKPLRGFKCIWDEQGFSVPPEGKGNQAG